MRGDHGSETDARGGDERRGHARWLARRVREESCARPRLVGPRPRLAQVHGQDLAPPLQGKHQRLMGLRCPAMRLRVQRPASTKRGAPPPRARGGSAAPEEGAPQAAEEMRRCPGQAPGQLGRCARIANARSRHIRGGARAAWREGARRERLADDTLPLGGLRGCGTRAERAWQHLAMRAAGRPARRAKAAPP